MLKRKSNLIVGGYLVTTGAISSKSAVITFTKTSSGVSEKFCVKLDKTQLETFANMTENISGGKFIPQTFNSSGSSLQVYDQFKASDEKEFHRHVIKTTSVDVQVTIMQAINCNIMTLSYDSSANNSTNYTFAIVAADRTEKYRLNEFISDLQMVILD